MAGNNIKGITISLGADTTQLTSALKDVDKQSKSLTNELKAVDKALKLDPSNVELAAQRQEVLTEAVQSTSKRLEVLKQAQSQVEEQFRNGDLGVEQYRAFQRELSTTEAQLKAYENQIASSVADQTRLAQSTNELTTFFKATGTEVDHFADVLGSRLTNAIREGSANADQMGRALQLMGRHALGASADIDQMRNALRNADAGSSLNDIRQDLGRIADEADDAGNAVNGFGDKLKGVAGGLAAGGGIAGLFQQALDVSTLNTNIDISMNLNEADSKAVRQSIMEVTSAIGDEEGAYEGVRRQMALNKDASMETNQKIITGASMVSKAYKEIDFKELIQETHEIGKELGISQQDALALTNQLLSVGFPPEQLDIIAEYGQQLQRAGFDAEQVQAIMSAGVETGTWNIDNLLDGLKEGRIRASEFGQGLTNAQKEAVEGAGFTEQKFIDLGIAIAKGGDEGNKAFQEMTKMLMSVEDETSRNALGVEIFGTMWEDQGENISNTILNMSDHMKTASDMQNKLNGDVDKLNADPAYALSKAIGNVKEAFAPLLANIALVIAKIANWASENTTLVAILIAIAGIIATVVGVCMALAPVLMVITTSAGLLAGAMTLLTSPITLIIAGIALLVGALIYAYTHFEGFRNIVDSTFKVIKDVVVKVLGFVVDFIKEKLVEIKKYWNENGEQIKQAVTYLWNGIKTVFEVVLGVVVDVVKDAWNNIKNIIEGVIKIIQGIIKVFSGLLTGDWQKMWDGIKDILSGVVQAIWNLVELWFIGKILKVFKLFGDTLKGVFKTLGDNIKSIWDNIAKFTSDSWNKIKDFIMTPVNSAKDSVNKAFTAIKDWISSSVGTVLSTVTSKFNSVKDAMMKPVEAAKNAIKSAIDSIKGFFSGLKLSFPKITMPKMPHFKMTGSFSLNPPSVPKIGIDWYAKGGIMTNPTAFGINGNNLMVGGEAGAEAILPLTAKVLGGIGDGIAKTMSRMNQPQIINVNPAPIMLDGQVIAEVTFNTVSELQNNYTNIKALSKGVNL